jgi:hypothetical protein
MFVLENLHELSERVRNELHNDQKAVCTEEATKTAFIMPFLQLLGYDVFNPSEICPEYTADVGLKKGEKVDFAVLKNGQPIILMECKTLTTDLKTSHISQLFRYFCTTEAKIAILTNGAEYQFFTDLNSVNVMDNNPFMVLNLLDIDAIKGNLEVQKQLQKLSKGSFNIGEVVDLASAQYVNRLLQAYLEKNLVEPDPDLIKFFATKFHGGRATKKILDGYEPLVKKGLNQFINHKVQSKLKSALEESFSCEEGDPSIVTTEEEMTGYHIIRSILARKVAIQRVSFHDTINYFGIFLDNNRRKPICRLHFNSKSNKYLELFDKGKQETEKVVLNNLNSIYEYENRILQAVQVYEDSPVKIS